MQSALASHGRLSLVEHSSISAKGSNLFITFINIDVSSRLRVITLRVENGEPKEWVQNEARNGREKKLTGISFRS